MKAVSPRYVQVETLLLRSERNGYWVARLTGKPDQRVRIVDEALDRIYASSVTAKFSATRIDSPQGLG